MSKNSLLTLLLLPWIAAGCTGTEEDAVRHFIAHRAIRLVVFSQTYRENFFCSFIAIFSHFLFVLLTL